MSSSPPPNKSTPLLILGGGTWGLSSALSLARRGYTSILVLDRYAIPSPTSAGNDANKIVEEGCVSSSDTTEEQYVWSWMQELASGYWRKDEAVSYTHLTLPTKRIV